MKLNLSCRAVLKTMLLSTSQQLLEVVSAFCAYERSKTLTSPVDPASSMTLWSHYFQNCKYDQAEI